MNMIKTGSLVLALQILLLPASILTITVLFFWLTIPITIVNFLLALINTIGLSLLLIKKNKHLTPLKYFKEKDFLKVTVIFVILILISLFLSMHVYDFSHDGQGYHQSAITALANGWNPFYQPFLEEYNLYYKKVVGGPIIFINHYTKASWITAASLFKLTGSLESGKMFHFLYLAAAFLITLHFLTYLKKIPKISKIIIAALTALNPVVLYQVFSFYNDSQLASLTTIVIVLSLQYIMFKDQKAVIFLSITLLTLCNIKFTGLIYGAAIVGMVWVTVRIIHKEWQVRFIKYMIVAFFTAVVIIGYQPYVTNTIHRGNPFYPTLRIEWAKKIAVKNIMKEQAPEAFMTKDRFQKLFYSLFSKSDNQIKHRPQLKIPFSIHGIEIKAFKYEDARYGGFGPLFGSVLLLVIACALVLLKLRGIIPIYTLIAVAVILLSTLINPEAWWARLSPQLWLLPIIFIAASYYLAKNRFIQYLRGVAIFLLLFNCFIILYTYTGHRLKMNRLFKSQMYWMAKISQRMDICWDVYPHNSYLSTQYRLKRFEVPHKMEKTLKTKRTRPIIGAWGAKFYIDDRVHKILKLQRNRKKRKQIYSAPGKKSKKIATKALNRETHCVKRAEKPESLAGCLVYRPILKYFQLLLS